MTDQDKYQDQPWLLMTVFVLMTIGIAWWAHFRIDKLEERVLELEVHQTLSSAASSAANPWGVEVDIPPLPVGCTLAKEYVICRDMKGALTVGSQPGGGLSQERKEQP